MSTGINRNLAASVGLEVDVLISSRKQNKYGIRLQHAEGYLFRGTSKKVDVFIKGYACAVRGMMTGGDSVSL